MHADSMRWISLLLLFVGGAVGAQPTPPASTQSYPTKPVRLVASAPAGGSTDLLARTLAQRLTAIWGRQVVVDNRGGAAGHIAGNFVARSDPDGYTLLVGTNGVLGTNLAIYSKLPYNALEDLTPITLLIFQPQALLVNPTVPASTVKEFIALVRSRPGQIKYGSAGPGGALHMAAELFSHMAGVKMLHVPYKGGAPILIDLIGGQIDTSFQPMPEAIPHAKGGRVRVLGVTSATRSASMPDVPTIAESGLPGYSYSSWMGAVGPAGMSKELTARISADINKALVSSDVQSRLTEAGLDIAGGTSEQLAAHMRDELAKTVKFVKEVGIPPID